MDINFVIGYNFILQLIHSTVATEILVIHFVIPKLEFKCRYPN